MAACFLNRYAGKCWRCSTRVIAGEGICERNEQGPGWLIGCRNCFPGEFANVYAAANAAAAKAKADLEALEARRLQKLAERDAIIKKLGIDLKDVRNEKYVQNSWSDDSTWEVPYKVEGTMEEFRLAVETKPDTGRVSLRVNQGVRLYGIDKARQVLLLSESVALCD